MSAGCGHDPVAVDLVLEVVDPGREVRALADRRRAAPSAGRCPPSAGRPPVGQPLLQVAQRTQRSTGAGRRGARRPGRRERPPRGAGRRRSATGLRAAPGSAWRRPSGGRGGGAGHRLRADARGGVPGVDRPRAQRLRSSSRPQEQRLRAVRPTGAPMLMRSGAGAAAPGRRRDGGAAGARRRSCGRGGDETARTGAAAGAGGDRLGPASGSADC